jgi:hypothetical protein
MLLGSYSIPQLLAMYKDTEQRSKLNNYVWLMTLAALLWIVALVLLIYYWNDLDLWAQVFGVIGLFFNAGGPLFTLLVIYIGMSDKSEQDENSPMTLIDKSSQKGKEESFFPPPVKVSSKQNSSFPPKITPLPSKMTPLPPTITPLPSKMTPLPPTITPLPPTITPRFVDDIPL